MAAALIFFPGAMPSFDRNGDTCVGELYFYKDDGSYDTKPVYASSALTTPLPFPVVSDASGAFPAIWADSAEFFTVTWTTRETSPRSKTLTGVQPSIDVIEVEGPPGPQGDPGTDGTDGTDGTNGDDGWTPLLASVVDGERRVQQVVDWEGGSGTKPATGKYIGPSGLVTDIADATNIRGAAGSGIGDLLAANNLSDVANTATALSNLGGLAEAGGTMTGALTLAADAANPLEPATKQQLDAAILNAGKRGRCRAATTGNITISTALNNGDSLDGVSLVTGDLVLVKDQTTASQNGVYVVGVTPVRSPEFDTWAEYPGSLISVEEGSANADTLWICTSNDGGTLGTTAIVFARIRIDIAIPVPVPQGGTGTTTLASHGVVLGNGTSAVNVTGAGTAGQVLTSNGASADPTFQAASGGNLGAVWARQEQASGVANADTAVSGSWVVLTLNTTAVNTISGAGVSGSQITGLPAGVYEVWANGSVGNSSGSGGQGRGRVRVYNATAAAAVAIGPVVTVSAGFSGNTPSLSAFCMGRFTLAATSAIELHEWTNANGIFGSAAGTTGTVEVYNEILLRRVA